MRYLLTSLLCVLTLSFTAQDDCPNPYDGNGDGAIGISDLLGLLALFGDVDSDSDGVFDSLDECIDDTACNYQSNPTQACSYLDVVGVCGGICNEDADGDGICDFECGEDLASFDGYDYETVQIGEQCWFAENCRYLPEVSPSSEESDTDPYYYVYDYQGTDVEAAKATANYETYGVLYNWPAVMTEGICPGGWHIPSDGDFTQLTDHLGGEYVAGGKMKDNVQWNGSNSSGFTGLPGGFYYQGSFSYNAIYGEWWSSSEAEVIPTSWDLFLNNSTQVYRNQNWRESGFSARCIKD